MEKRNNEREIHDRHNFQLSIDSYTNEELEDIFNVTPYNFGADYVKLQSQKLKKSVMQNIDLAQDTKQHMFDFIDNAEQKLLAKYNIISQSSHTYINTTTSDFYKGSLNQLNTRILNKNINIDTRFRPNYMATTSANFNLTLPIKLTDVVSLQLTALELPSTFYAISSVFGNNTLTINSTQITIPDGNYDYITLQSFINSQLQLHDALTDILFAIDLSGGINGSGKMTVTSSAEFSMNFLSYGQTSMQLTLGWMLGFRKSTYDSAASYVSEGVVCLLGPRYIYMVVNDYNNSASDGFYGAFESSILNKNILARISLQGSVFSVMSKDNYNLITEKRQYFGQVDIQNLQIQLLDEYGRIINLNNMDYSFCLSFQTIYNM